MKVAAVVVLVVCLLVFGPLLFVLVMGPTAAGACGTPTVDVGVPPAASATRDTTPTPAGFPLPATSGETSTFGGPGDVNALSWGYPGERSDHPVDLWYVAMRWPTSGPASGVGSMSWFRNRRIVISFGGRSVVGRVGDWGPADWTGRVIDLSPAIEAALAPDGSITNQVVTIAWDPTNASPLGPLSATSPVTVSAGLAAPTSCPPAPSATAPAGASGYANPFAGEQWTAMRTDQGVDWGPDVTEPVVAVGPGVVTFSSTHTGWPAGAFVVYRLTGGSHAGLYVFVAEHLTDLVPTGTAVAPGQQIAVAHPGSPWTEWGWAASPGTNASPATRYNGAPDGTPMPGGKAFARFLMELGAHPREDPGPGPDRPPEGS